MSGATSVSSDAPTSRLRSLRGFWGDDDSVWITLVSWLIVAAATAGSVWTFAKYHLQKPEYQASPIVLLAIGYLAYDRWRRRSPTLEVSEQGDLKRRVRSVVGTASGLFGGLTVLLGVALWSPWLVIVGLIISVATLVFRIHRDSVGPSLWPVWLLLLLIIPPPLNFDRELTTNLQLLSSSLASMLLEVIGILHVLNGNTLEIAGRELFVDEACSGIVSLVTIISAIAIYCVWQARSLPHTLIMLAVGTGWTVLMNAVRIAVITLALARFNVDWTEGFSHAALAVVLFALSLAVLRYSDYVLRELLRPIDESDVAYEGSSGGWLIRVWDRWIADHDLPEETGDIAFDETVEHVAIDTPPTLPRMRFTHRHFQLPMLTVVVIAPAIGLQFWTMPEQLPIVDSQLTATSLDTALALDRDVDPAGQVTNLSLVGFRIDHRDKLDMWGEHSRQWEYVDQAGHRYLVSLDFLFGPGWHDIKHCYPGIGWIVSNYRSTPYGRSVDRTTTATTSDVSLNAFDLRRSDSELIGYAVFLGFRPDGSGVLRPIQQEAGDVNSGVSLGQRVFRRFVQAVEDQDEQPIGTYYQLQVVCFDHQIDSQMEETAKAALLAAWGKLAQRLTQVD